MLNRGPIIGPLCRAVLRGLCMCPSMTTLGRPDSLTAGPDVGLTETEATRALSNRRRPARRVPLAGTVVCRHHRPCGPEGRPRGVDENAPRISVATWNLVPFVPGPSRATHRPVGQTGLSFAPLGPPTSSTTLVCRRLSRPSRPPARLGCSTRSARPRNPEGRSLQGDASSDSLPGVTRRAERRGIARAEQQLVRVEGLFDPGIVRPPSADDPIRTDVSTLNIHHDQLLARKPMMNDLPRLELGHEPCPPFSDGASMVARPVTLGQQAICPSGRTAITDTAGWLVGARKPQG